MGQPKKTLASLVEIRRLTVHERNSQETLCFACDIYVQGVKVGVASNHGTGGNTDVHIKDIVPRAVVTAMAETLTTPGFPTVRASGTTTCCNAFTTIGDGPEFCKACGEEVIGSRGIDCPLEYVIDRLVDIAYTAKREAKTEAKYVKIDKKECARNDLLGRLTMRYTVSTPKGVLTVWPHLAPGEDPEQVVATLNAKHKGTGTWKIIKIQRAKISFVDSDS